MTEYTYWDLGEEETIRPSRKVMADVLLALIQCNGRIHQIHASGAELDGDVVLNCSAVAFRISLPIGNSNLFQDLTGLTLTHCDQVAGS